MHRRLVSISFPIYLIILTLGSTFTFAIRQPIDNLVVFGDSQSDLGNSNRWTNGPAWSENLAIAWNASLHSFAYSGSVCDNALYLNMSDPAPSIRNQIDLFYSLDMELVPDRTVFAIWVGMNDIQKIHDKQQQLPDTRPTIEEVAFCIAQQIRQLRKAFGVNRIMVFAVPPLQYMPYFATAENNEEMGIAAETLSYLIREDAVVINKHHHAFELDMVDIHSLLSDMTEMPGSFVLDNVVEAYVDACKDACTDDADRYIWWDNIHLTGGIHRQIANAILSAESYSLQDARPELSSAEIKALVEKAGSQFRSPVYHPLSNTGQFDRFMEELEKAPLKTIYIEQDQDVDLTRSWCQKMTVTHWLIPFSVACSILGCCWWVKYHRQKDRLDMSELSNSPLHHPRALAAQHRGHVFSPFRRSSSGVMSMNEQHKLRLSG